MKDYMHKTKRKNRREFSKGRGKTKTRSKTKNHVKIKEKRTLEYDNLVIEGGGVLGIAYLGALKELYADHSIEKATAFVGTSIGSLVATILAVRTPYEKLEKIILDLNLKDFKDRSWIGQDIYRLFKQFGFYRGDKLLKFIKKILGSITGKPLITFKEVFDRYGTKLVITGSNISKGMITYFSVDDYPNMPIALANRISCSVPYFFRAILYDDQYYVDGGLLDNYPIGYFDLKIGKSEVLSCKKTLGLKLISNHDIDQENGNEFPITGMKSFTQNLMNTVMNQALRIHVKPDDWERTVRIYTADLSFLNFDLTESEKNFLIVQGKKAITEFKLNKLCFNKKGNLYIME